MKKFKGSEGNRVRGDNRDHVGSYKVKGRSLCWVVDVNEVVKVKEIKKL